MTTVFTYECVHEWRGKWVQIWDSGYWYTGPMPTACREPSTELYKQLAPPYQIFQIWVWTPNDNLFNKGEWDRSQVDSNYLAGPHTCFSV